MELPDAYKVAMEEYNESLRNDGMEMFAVSATNFLQLEEVDFLPLIYRGPENAFFTLLEKVQEVCNNVNECKRLQEQRENLRRRNAFIKKFDYFYGCFMLLKKYIRSKIKPCEHAIDFEWFEKKVKECTCGSCVENKSLNVYLLHLQNLFNMVYELQKNKAACVKINEFYTCYGHFKEELDTSRKALEEVKRNLSQ
ncbi:hypothetical protein EHP00_1075 [Ecytonucleospora hepatopenaei]|uniref:Uncharacterized protein n=1 Tax=Ecytonucleospora hepatopenaei TaxID=646526 RepID=A0A1W0E580_9MICR|nr:hypothetical protein EHP00_1075 [Ecytonucleospora hepatopenaei]